MLRKLLRRLRGTKTHSPHWQKTRIGFVLLTMGVVTAAELDEASERCGDSGKLLGDALIEMGAISPDALAVALNLQKRMRNGDRGGAMLDIHEHRTQKHYTRLGLDTPHAA